MSGHNYRRYDKKKVTRHNQYLGPFVNHEMNRCITCYRCVGFMMIMRVEILCAGIITRISVVTKKARWRTSSAATLLKCAQQVFLPIRFSRRRTRASGIADCASICTGCSPGCHSESATAVAPVVNRYNSEVNSYFICDRGRWLGVR